MKKFFLTIALATVFSQTAYTALAQTFNGGIEATDIRITPTGGSVLLEMKLVVADNAVTKLQGLAIIPYISNGIRTVEFPYVLVNGKNRNRIFERQRKFRNTEIAQNPPREVMVIDRKHKGGTIDYSASVVREGWMDSGVVGVRFVLTSPAGERQYFTATPTELRMPPVPATPPAPVVVYEPEPAPARIAPVMPEAPRSARSVSGSADLDFETGSSRLMPDYKRNPRELAKIKEAMDAVGRDPHAHITSLEITGYASIEGASSVNERLAFDRASELARYLQSNYGIEASASSVRAVGEDWEGLRRMVAGSDLPYMDAVLDIIDSRESADEKETRLRKIMGGNIWRIISRDMLPELRRVEWKINYEVF